MKVVFTDHARQQMDERNISEMQVRNTVILPMQVVRSESGRYIAQRIYKKDSREMLLRVFYEKKNGENVVVTAYWTSKITKYYPRRQNESQV